MPGGERSRIPKARLASRVALTALAKPENYTHAVETDSFVLSFNKCSLSVALGRALS